MRHSLRHETRASRDRRAAKPEHDRHGRSSQQNQTVIYLACRPGDYAESQANLTLPIREGLPTNHATCVLVVFWDASIGGITAHSLAKRLRGS